MSSGISFSSPPALLLTDGISFSSPPALLLLTAASPPTAGSLRLVFHGMEGNLVTATKIDFSSEADLLKSLSHLSTILVATIEEVKDRVSQMEFIFCGQLFPGFQSTTKSLQRKLVDTSKAAEDEWKKKENVLLEQLKELHGERQRCQEEIQHLHSSFEENKTRLTCAEQLVKKHELEKGSLMDKLERLMKNEDIVDELKMRLEQKASELSEAKELQKRLLEENALKDQKLLIEQAKTKHCLEEHEKMIRSYKELKSQYLYLLRKVNGNSANEHQLDRMQEVKNSPNSHPKKRSLQDSKEEGEEEEEEEEEEITNIASQTDEPKTEIDFHENPEIHQDLQVVKRLSNDPRIIRSFGSRLILPKHTAIAKPEPFAGVKKASSSWRETRAQETRGVDPHDDFLDTPLEIVRNLNKFPCQEPQDIAVPPPQDMDFSNSDDETQDMNNKIIPDQQRISILGPANKGFKYVEPVRKKAERENLKGVECQQCKKFYDAVLPGGDNNPNQMNRRCEHHDAVSRHRYRFAPPMTPEGFWNIGFDSDM
ncbi:protein gamma response 1 isoform X2 [Canna indica]|uniref:Protein gamma response 1 isoform X2 n=1 Tax=Canna indica TaxID=4628 RepID=A0AAQ3Q1K7_9LILI|nr:protein gamma response 1 isoform X2 [Canna indica]